MGISVGSAGFGKVFPVDLCCFQPVVLPVDAAESVKEFFPPVVGEHTYCGPFIGEFCTDVSRKPDSRNPSGPVMDMISSIVSFFAEGLIMDETSVQVLKEDDRRTQTKSYFRVIRTREDGLSPIILYNYTPTGTGENARRFLNGIAPGFYLMADRYHGYNKVQETNRCCCFAHIHRYLLESMPKGMDKDCTNPAVHSFLYCEKQFAYGQSYQEKDLAINKSPPQR